MSAFWSKPKSLGLDAGTRALKAVQLRRAPSGWELDRYFYFDAWESLESSLPLEARLPGLVEIHELKNTVTAFSIPDLEVSMFNLRLPPMPDNELESAVRSEVEQRLSFPIEEAVIDFFSEKTPEGVTARAFCVRRSLVEGRLADLEEARLKPWAAESEMLANIAAAEHNGYLSEQGADVVIDLGNSHTSVALVIDAEARFVQTLPLGGKHLNDALCADLEISRAEADRLLRGEQHPEMVAIQNERLLREIKKTLDYFQENFSPVLTKVLLVGGSSVRSGLAAECENYFGIPIEIVDPLRKIGINASTLGSDAKLASLVPYLSVAIGLALRRTS